MTAKSIFIKGAGGKFGACAAFRKESRMKFAEPTKFNRKSGGAKWRDLRFNLFVLTNF